MPMGITYTINAASSASDKSLNVPGLLILRMISTEVDVVAGPTGFACFTVLKRTSCARRQVSQVVRRQPMCLDGHATSLAAVKFHRQSGLARAFLLSADVQLTPGIRLVTHVSGGRQFLKSRSCQVFPINIVSRVILLAPVTSNSLTESNECYFSKRSRTVTKMFL